MDEPWALDWDVLARPGAHRLPGLRGRLHTIAIERSIGGQRLRLLALTAAPWAPPSPLAGEPVEGAIARLTQALRFPDGAWCLRSPEILGPQRIGYARGCHLIDLAASDPVGQAVDCWDAALSQGFPLYAVTGRLVPTDRPRSVADLLASLVYGSFHVSTGPLLSSLVEGRQGLELGLKEVADLRVIVRGGFEARRERGLTLRWRDRGDEGYVRVEASTADGTVWTQPRLVMPLGPA